MASLTIHLNNGGSLVPALEGPTEDLGTMARELLNRRDPFTVELTDETEASLTADKITYIHVTKDDEQAQ